MTEKRKVRIGRLTTVGQVASELGRLYRQARRGDVAVADASRLATILAAMRQCLEASELASDYRHGGYFSTGQRDQLCCAAKV